MDLGLNGKKVFLSGSSRGLGYATAAILAAEGCQVVINGRDQERLKSSAATLSAETGGEIHFLVGDAGQPESAAKLIQQAAEKLGGIDLLVTNTGGPPSGKFTDHANQVWEDAVNLVFLSRLNHHI